MTTVVYASGVVAADSRTISGQLIWPFEVQKLWRIDSSVFAVTGEIEPLEAIREWTEAKGFISNAERPDLENTTLIEFLEDGEILEYSGKDSVLRITPLLRGFMAWGSGKEVAFGALECGADPGEAVRIAAKYDTATGGTIRVMDVKNGGER